MRVVFNALYFYQRSNWTQPVFHCLFVIVFFPYNKTKYKWLQSTICQRLLILANGYIKIVKIFILIRNYDDGLICVKAFILTVLPKHLKQC